MAVGLLTVVKIELLSPSKVCVLMNVRLRGNRRRAPLQVSAWLINSNLVTLMDLPPKDPNDDDENEEDEQGDDEEEQEPAVIREPDEC
jgi:hypothetical protein